MPFGVIAAPFEDSAPFLAAAAAALLRLPEARSGPGPSWEGEESGSLSFADLFDLLDVDDEGCWPIEGAWSEEDSDEGGGCGECDLDLCSLLVSAAKR